MIPEFNEDGYLPPGIYEASFEEVKNRLDLVGSGRNCCGNVFLTGAM